MTHQIITIGAEHIAGFRNVLDSVARERRYLAFLDAPPIEAVEVFVLDNIAAGMPQYVAICDDRVVGWCDVLAKSRPTRRHCGMLGIGVIEGYRDRGIGRALMETTLQAARSKGLTRVELTVRTDNIRAIRLYERFGFTIEGVVRRDMLVDDQYRDSLLMALLFDTP
ncbi:MAG: GNAT family N-acetyltransferase [Candidatus Muproteobacteria bacterium RBG_16_60_9]|uniref:GNAT family N-acetyltransferase n=1 Tax=Candidatus Muproteobacteria bacterium RBG_16_60_9 TaxID=1817755 RepID=A0A1F6UZ28_9PROT|nr:MAG: GNAT family N-acetyltransferase [Candidatus Muproteobacteria bacterium RBG_16_60_9]